MSQQYDGDPNHPSKSPDSLSQRKLLFWHGFALGFPLAFFDTVAASFLWPLLGWGVLSLPLASLSAAAWLIAGRKHRRFGIGLLIGLLVWGLITGWCVLEVVAFSEL